MDSDDSDDKKALAHRKIEELIFKASATRHEVKETRSVEIVTAEVVQANSEKFAKPKLFEFAIPARQASVKVAIGVGGIIVWGITAKLCAFSDEIAAWGFRGIIAIFGINAVVEGTSKVIDKLRPPKALPPRES